MAPVIAVVAKVVAAAVAKITIGAIAKFVLTTALSIGVSKLIAKRAMSKAQAGGDGGGRVQLPPATDNKLPVVYGSAFIGGPIVDAMLSSDQKTMWYVVALSEVTNTSSGSTISFGNIYYDGKLVEFGTQGAVTALITNDNPNTALAQRDTRVAGYLNIYLYNNGSNSPTNSSLTASQVLSIANGVPAGKAWGSNQTMTNCAFAIIKVKYSTDAGTTGAGALMAQIINTESGQSTGTFRPGSAILDYMRNDRYGCAIPLSRIDTASLTALNTYSDQTIDVTGGPSATQARYRINGPLDTGSDCLTNLQYLVDSCDSWLQYSELTGKWRVVINKAYDQSPDPQTLSNLFLVDSNNLVGGIELSPIDLNETYNQVEVAYPNKFIKDQTDYQIIDLFVTNQNLLSQNEAVNRLNITLPLVNNAVQAKYIAARRVYQSREDLVITFKLDFSGIQIEAGDVIRVTHETYGWTEKLFRVNSVAEEKDTEGNLSAVVQAFEYNGTVFVDDPVADFIPEANTGLLDPNVIEQPGTPVITVNSVASGQIDSFKVTSIVPASGLVLYMDYNYGITSNVQQHILYRTLQQSNGDPFTNSTSTSLDINDLPAGEYYFSTTGRNNTSGRRSNASAQFNWTGANITEPVVLTICNVSSNGNLFTHDSSTDIVANAIITIVNGVGTLSANTRVAQVISNTEFTSSILPVDPLSNACINVIYGGVDGNTSIQPNSVSYTKINNSALPRALVLEAGGGLITNYPNVSLPVDIKSNSYNAGIPGSFYLTSNTTYDPNYYYPYYQGTSTIANGYADNSSGSFTPADAAFIIDAPSSDRWYTACLLPIDLSPNWPLSNDETLELEITASFTSTQDTLVQVLPFYQYGGNLLGISISDAQFINTVTVPANITTVFDFEIGFSPFLGANLQEGYSTTGWFVRNLSNSNLICAYQFTSAYKRRQGL